VQNPPPQNNHLFEELEKVASITIVAIDDATLVSSSRDVMDRAWKIDTKLGGHDAPEISTVREPSVETSSYLGTRHRQHVKLLFWL
jgi:hypothetical protein